MRLETFGEVGRLDANEDKATKLWKITMRIRLGKAPRVTAFLTAGPKPPGGPQKGGKKYWQLPLWK